MWNKIGKDLNYKDQEKSYKIKKKYPSLAPVESYTVKAQGPPLPSSGILPCPMLYNHALVAPDRRLSE